MISELIVRSLLLFFIYAFLGWCCEVAYAAFLEWRFVNRGFLNGPICPIYGIGVVSVVKVLHPFSGSLPLLFVGSMLLTSLIEFLTGFILERLFHAKWWDYSEQPLNIMGYVCLSMSILWGLACVFVVRVLHPMILNAVNHLSFPLQISVVSVFSAIMLVDGAATLAAIRSLQRKLRRLTDIASEIHAVSDEIGQVISDATLLAMLKAEAGEKALNSGVQKLHEKGIQTAEYITEQKNHAEAVIQDKRQRVGNRLIHKKEQIFDNYNSAVEYLAALKERFNNALDETTFGQHRLVKAFPNLKVATHQPALRVLRERIDRIRNNHKAR